MDNEVRISYTSVEQEEWNKNHTVLNNKILDEAKHFNIKAMSIQFWVYNLHRDLELYGKYPYCVAGIDWMATKLGLTKRQVLDAYVELQRKKAIVHVWCDNKIYRSKTMVYLSEAHIQSTGLSISPNQIVNGNAKSLTKAVESGVSPLVIVEELGKSNNELGKSKYNKSNITNINKQQKENHQQVDGGVKNNKDDNTIDKLFYDVIKLNSLPVANHNTIRSHITKLKKDMGSAASDYLTKLLTYDGLKGDFKPALNSSTDIYFKHKSITTWLEKSTPPKNDLKEKYEQYLKEHGL